VLNNPLTFIDPTGLDWQYSQSTGQLTHIDANGNSTNAGTGYAGHGQGVNNPAMQNVRMLVLYRRAPTQLTRSKITPQASEHGYLLQ